MNDHTIFNSQTFYILLTSCDFKKTWLQVPFERFILFLNKNDLKMSTFYLTIMIFILNFILFLIIL